MYLRHRFDYPLIAISVQCNLTNFDCMDLVQQHFSIHVHSHLLTICLSLFLFKATFSLYLSPFLFKVCIFNTLLRYFSFDLFVSAISQLSIPAAWIDSQTSNVYCLRLPTGIERGTDYHIW